MFKSIIFKPTLFKFKPLFRFKRNYKIQQASQANHLDNPLTDTFGRHHTYLRISLTERCNLRCKYCMPKDGVNLTENSKLLTTEEIIYLAKIFVTHGVDKIRLTGGEPTLRKDLPDIIYQLKEIPFLKSVSITTNGLVLTKKLVELQNAGLDALNISLDTLNKSKYEEITRRKGMERVLMGIDLAIQLGFNPVKINCVVMKGFNDDEIIDFINFTKNKNVDVRFIEYMPFSGNNWEMKKMIPYDKMLKMIKNSFPTIQELKNGPNDTSKAWKIPEHHGQIGFITSMSNMFCNTCNRLRITADGNLKHCLFGNKEISLRDAIRNGIKEDDLITMISVAVKRKEKHHGDNLKKLPITSSLSSNNSFTFKMTIKRNYSDDAKSKTLTHINENGKATMVDVSKKDITNRVAVAKGSIYVGTKVMALIKENNLKKGDVLNVSKLAGIMAAKRTSELIPLCHNIQLNNINVNIILRDRDLLIEAIVSCDGKTGVEMEALTAVSITALTIYDMCKAINKNMIINNIELVSKTGGKSIGTDDEVFVRKYEDMKLQKKTVFIGSI